MKSNQALRTLSFNRSLCTRASIESAFRQATLSCHPDRNGGSTEDFLQLSNAKKSLLSDLELAKSNNKKLFCFRPTLIQVIECRYHITKINNTVYHIPLWHEKVYCDEFQGIIEPVCPPFVWVDENRDLYVNARIQRKNIAQCLTILGINLAIPRASKKITNGELLRYENCGIPKIIQNKPLQKIERHDIVLLIIYHN